MLIIEAILTIFAWRNGWKWYSLIPIAVAFGLGFILGMLITLSGGNVGNGLWGIILDVGAIAALIVMACKKPKEQILNNNEKK